VSFLFGGGARRREHELAEGRRRAELRFARDIGNEAALQRHAEPPRGRIRMWPVAVVALVMVLGGLGLLPKVSRVDIARSCTTPALALEQYEAGPNTAMEWKATGPSTGDYVLVADGGAVTAHGDTVLVEGGGTALSPVFQMTDCLTDQSLATPSQPGKHTLRLLRREGIGEFTQVASVDLHVK
jgi:hypothetical protein